MDPYYKEWVEQQWHEKKKCSLCNQFAEVEPDFDIRPKQYFNPKDGLTSFMSYPFNKVELCYYHRKLKEGLFGAVERMTFEFWLKRRKHVSNRSRKSKVSKREG